MGKMFANQTKKYIQGKTNIIITKKIVNRKKSEEEKK